MEPAEEAPVALEEPPLLSGETARLPLGTGAMEPAQLPIENATPTSLGDEMEVKLIPKSSR